MAAVCPCLSCVSDSVLAQTDDFVPKLLFRKGNSTLHNVHFTLPQVIGRNIILSGF